MTLPIYADCVVELDGVPVADTPADLEAGVPTALAGLSIAWGREDATTQPDAAVCRFIIRDRHGVDSALGAVHVGQPVTVWAAGPSGAGGGPYYPTPGFDDYPTGPLPADAYATDTTLTATVTDQPSGKAARIAGPPGHLWIAPNPFNAGDPASWDDLPQIRPGETWPITVTARAPGAGPAAGAVDAANLAADPIGDTSTTAGTFWTVSRVSVVADTGYRRLTVTDANPANLAQRLNSPGAGLPDRISVAAGERVRVIGQARAAGTFPLQIQIVWRDAAGGSLGAAPGATLTPNPAGFADLPEASGVAPAGVDHAQIQIGIAGTGPRTIGDTFDVRHVAVVKAAAPVPYFDGDTPPDATHGYRWTGAPRASTSERYLWDLDHLPVTVAARGYTAPRPDAGVDLLVVDAPPITGSDHPVTVTGTVTLPAAAAGPVWLAVGVRVDLTATLSWAQTTGTWADHPETWDTYGTVDLYRVQATVPTAPSQRVLVFAGHVTDALARPADQGAVDLTVTAADISADLGSDVIGDEPWPAEPLAARVARIGAASAIGPEIIIADSLAAPVVSWRDVDAQPVVGLLQDLAQTVGGILWPSEHATTGGYLWMEDPTNRAALRELALIGGIITITGAGSDGITVVSACDILRGPVELSQTVTEITTVVAVSWLEQTLDDDGNPAPTERTVVLTDPDALDQYGLRRYSVATELTTHGDAVALATRTLARSRAAAWKANGYTLDTALVPDDVPSLPVAERQAALMALLDGTRRIGLPITLTDLPPWFPAATAGVFVEGGTYTYTGGAWRLELTVTPGKSAGQLVTWAELDPAWTWDQWDPDLTWADLAGVGG